MAIPNAQPLPPSQFIGGNFLYFAGLPIGINNGGSRALPSGTTATWIDFSGYNTLSVFVTIADTAGADVFALSVGVADPETATTVGLEELISEDGDGSFAATLYLPAFYATLDDAVLPFTNTNFLLLTYTGATSSTVHVTALKLWLTNA